MNSQTISYKSLTYNAVRAFLFGFPVFILLTLSVIGLAKYLQSFAVALTGWVTLCLVPFIFQKQCRNLFTRRVDLVFDNQMFFLKEYTLKTGELVKDLAIAWGDIKSYKFYFSQSNVTYLVIYLRNGSTEHLSFNDEKNQQQALKEKSIFSIFFYFVKQYNLAKQSEQQIFYEPGFWTSTAGKFTLIGLSFLSIVAIIFHIIFHPETSIFSFMGIFMTLWFVIKRKTDKEFYNKITQLEALPELSNESVDKE